MLASLSDAMALDWCACFMFRGTALVCEGLAARCRAPFAGQHRLAHAPGLATDIAQTREGSVTTPREWFGQLPDYATIVTFPIRAHGELAGVLVLQAGDALDAVRRADFQRFIPCQFDCAVEWGRVSAGVGDHSSLMQMMMKVSRVAVEEVGLERSLRRITTYISDNFPVAAASIILLDESGEKFIMEVASGGIELCPPPGSDWPITLGVCGRCVRTAEPQLILEPDTDPDYVPGNERVKSEYVVPIRFRRRILGVLNLESIERDTFSEMVRMVLRNLADQIAGAVHLSVTHQQLADSMAATEKQKKELERVNRELQQANMLLQELAEIDSLTGLPNRRVFDRLLDDECYRATRMRVPVSLLLIDIDDFRRLNDRQGHLYGDTCLKRLAGDLKAMAQKMMRQVSRIGAEEFAIVLGNTDSRRAYLFAEELRLGIERNRIGRRGAEDVKSLTVSIGVATATALSEALRETLLREAGRALAAAKHAGKNCVATRRG